MKYNKLIVFIIIFQLTFLLGYSQNKHVVILHTNDVHSQMEPIKSGKEKNRGGLIRLAAAINEIRSENENVLLLDAGDFWQSTSYFNLFYGKVDIELMNEMHYDAAVLGNHQFDLGIDTLVKRIKEANFPILAANYDLSNSPLKEITKPYIIIERGGLRFGIIGICVDLETLVSDASHLGLSYLDPIPIVNELAKKLKTEDKCNVIVVLSHLGYQMNNAIDDIKLAENSENVDIIIGGHSHTLPKDVSNAYNKKGKEVIIRQMRKSGIYLGRIDIEK